MKLASLNLENPFDHPKSMLGLIAWSLVFHAASPAGADGSGCSPPTIDGALDDMVAYASCSSIGLCGMMREDDSADICANSSFNPCRDDLIIPCQAQAGAAQVYWPNGADIVFVVAAYHTESDILYLGLRTASAIGDANGDGDAGSNPSNCDGTNVVDQPGIGPSEVYYFFVDTNCDGAPDISVEVSGNTVTVTPPGGSTMLAYNGADLEVSIEALGLPRIACVGAFANFNFDGFNDDLTIPACCATPSPDVAMELSCPPGIVPNTTRGVTATISNNGEVDLDAAELWLSVPPGLMLAGIVDIGEWDSCAVTGDTLHCLDAMVPIGADRAVVFDVSADFGCDEESISATGIGVFGQPNCAKQSAGSDQAECVITCAKTAVGTTEDGEAPFYPKPNPFRDTTRMTYAVSAEAPIRVLVVVYDATGREVRTLLNEMQDQGVYDVDWDGRTEDGLNRAAAGTYFLRVSLGEQSYTRRIVLLN